MHKVVLICIFVWATQCFQRLSLPSQIVTPLVHSPLRIAAYEVNVSFPSVAPSGKITIQATVTAPSVPNPDSKWPAVLLVPGSGGVDRNVIAPATIINWAVPKTPLCGVNSVSTRSFGDLASGFAAQGIVSLRYDKRICLSISNPACSYPPALNFTALTLQDYVIDATSALEYLASLPYVDSSNITLIGHSEGSGIVPSVALSASIRVHRVVLLMGVAISYSNIILQQNFAGNTLILDAGVQACELEGNTPLVVALRQAMLDSFSNYVKSVPYYSQLANNSLPPGNIAEPLECLGFGNCITNAYYYSWNSHVGPDAQRQNLQKLSQQGIPILIMNSPGDLLVTPDIYRALHSIGKELNGVEVIEYPNILHLLVPNDGSSGTVVPGVVNKLAQFILGQNNMF